jgi:hypothetical protein
MVRRGLWTTHLTAPKDRWDASAKAGRKNQSDSRSRLGAWAGACSCPGPGRACRGAAVAERTIATLKTWRILFTNYRRPLKTFRSSFRAAIGLYFFKEAFA